MTEGLPSSGMVLILDPDQDHREFLMRVLIDEGLQVLGVPEMDKALRILREEPPDLVVAVAGNEEGQPEELLDALRSDPEVGQIPVIVITDRMSRDLLDHFTAADAADLLQKPIPAGEFTVRVRELLRSAGRVSRDGFPLPHAELKDLREAGLSVLDACPTWIIVADEYLRVLFVNGTLLELWDTSLPLILGRRLDRMLIADLDEGRHAIRAAKEVLATQRPATLTALRFHPRSGTERAVDLTITPVTIGDRPHALLTLCDVSEHWFTGETIRQEKRKLEEIVNGMGAALGVLDRDLHVVWANKTFEKWFGEMWGKRFDFALRGLMLVGDTDPERIFTEVEHTSREWAHYTADGDKRYYRNIILPTHDSFGRLKELILVTQDLTEVTLRAEQHRLLRDLANLMQSTLDLDRLLYIILTCSTAGHALGFNRAFLFLTDSETGELRGEMGVGPGSQEEAFVIWAELAGAQRSLTDLTSDYQQAEILESRPLARMVRELSYPLAGQDASREIVARTALENQTQLVRDVELDPRVTPEFREKFGNREFVAVPLATKGRVIGVLLADNIFSSRPISEEQVNILELFASPAALAIDNARTYAELKLSLEQRREAQEALIQSERLATVGRLAAHVAHEIRNPLTTVGGFARSILKAPEDGVRVRRAAGIIAEEVLRLEGILSEVMDFTRPARVMPRPVDVNELVSKCLALLEEEAAESGIALEFLPGEGLSLCALDETQIHQVLLNLIRNAFEALLDQQDREAPARVVVSTRAVEDAVELDVLDNGPGLPPDLVEDIFEPFISGKVAGTGLGLAVGRKIMLDHGGDIRVSSEPGRGAVFTLTLPLAEEGEET